MPKVPLMSALAPGEGLASAAELVGLNLPSARMPSERLKAAYVTVQAGQEIAFRMIRDGADAREIHQKILALFEQRGFPTGKINGRMQGFFHGTGHGLGLDIHEPPRLAASPATLRTGHVVTVEPGLYYIGMGGVRLEDVVLVTPAGNRNLTRYPKFLEI